MDIASVISGIGAGVTYALTSYAKKQNEPWEWEKFLTTVILGAVAGLFVGLSNMQVDSAYEFVIQLGMIPLIENTLKIIYRKVLSSGTG